MTAIFRSPHRLRSRLSGYGLHIIPRQKRSGLNVGSQRILSRLAQLQRGQDHVGSYRRSPEDFVTESVRESVQDGCTTASNRRLADSARAYGRLWIGNFDRCPFHLVRDIQNCWRLGVMETPGEGQAVVLIVNPLLANSVTDAQDGSSQNLAAQRPWMKHSAHVGVCEEIQNMILAGFKVGCK